MYKRLGLVLLAMFLACNFKSFSQNMDKNMEKVAFVLGERGSRFGMAQSDEPPREPKARSRLAVQGLPNLCGPHRARIHQGRPHRGPGRQQRRADQ